MPGEERIRELISGAKDYAAEPPRPLSRQIPAEEPFPISALVEMMEAAANAIHQTTQAPMAICAQSVLAVATLAVQGYADVRLPTGAARPISNFFITIAESGDRKTSADNSALIPVTEVERELKFEFDQAAYDFQCTYDAWNRERQQILADKRRDLNARRAALAELGPAPQPPLLPMLTCPEPTFEGLTRMLREGHPGIGVFSSDGGQFIGGHAMNEENRLKTASALSQLWDGLPIKRVRQGDGSFVLPGRRVCIHLLIQPGVAVRLFGDPVLRDQGLTSRFLAEMPGSSAGSRFWRQPDFSSFSRFSRRARLILRGPLPLAQGKRNELEPRILELDADAARIWVEFADLIEKQMGAGGPLEPVRPLANKIPEHAARIAAVLELFQDIDAKRVSAGSMAAGIVLAQHYLAEGLRIESAGSIPSDLRLAKKLLDWLHTGRLTRDIDSPLVSLADIYQRGPYGIRDKATASRIVKILEDHGWLFRVPEGATIENKFRREVWRVRGNGA